MPIHQRGSTTETELRAAYQIVVHRMGDQKPHDDGAHTDRGANAATAAGATTMRARCQPKRWPSAVWLKVEGGYRQLLAMDAAADIDIDWPGQLAANLRALGGEYAIVFSFDPPEGSMRRPDRVLAHLILDDLANNAAKSGAKRCDVVLERTADGFIASATDDGRKIAADQWLREGGGLQRLNTSLLRRGGGINYDNELSDGRKCVTAQWVSVADSEIGDT